MLIIGLGHKARQGKNTAARALLNCYPIATRVRQYAYGDALRAEVNKAIRVDGLYGFIARGGFIADHPHKLGNYWQPLPEWVKAEAGKPRTLLQWWGTDYRRAQDTGYWVTKLRETLTRENPDVAIITDVRFPNEVDYAHASGGLVIKVTRTSKPDIDVPEHESEKALDGYTGWDHELSAATVPELIRKTEALYKKIAGK